MKKRLGLLTPVLSSILLCTNASADVKDPFDETPQVREVTAKGLDRTADPILLRGEDMPAMLGLPLAGFRLFASHGGHILPVPFQIDEIDGKGWYVLPEGKKPNRDIGRRGKKEERQGELDGNDELVFMAGDLGDRIPPAAWPADANRGIEIEAADPKTGESGWAYLLWITDPPPLAGADYVAYTRREDRIDARSFTIGYSAEKDLVYSSFLSVTPRGGGDNTNVLDRMNIRLWATLRLGGITFSRDEDDFVSEVIAYKDGPVRVMRRVANSMRLVAGLRAPDTIAYSMYYRDSVSAPNELRIPFNVSAVAKELHFEGGADYNHRAVGMRFFSTGNRGGVLVDGRMSPEESAMDRESHRWILLTGDQGNIMARVTLGPGFQGVIGKELLYRDDILNPHAPEAEQGSTPKLGVGMTNLLALKKGRYTYSVLAYFLPDARPGTVRAYLDILDHPLEIRVRPRKDNP